MRSIDEVPEATVPAEWRIPRRRYRGLCYQRAFKWLADHPGIPGARLVHGRYHCNFPGGGLGHAWVELPGGIIFDGNTSRFYQREAYLRVMRCERDASYSREEAIRLMLERSTYGIWLRGR